MDVTLLLLIILLASANSALAFSCPPGWDWPGLHHDECYQWAGDFDINDWRDSIQNCQELGGFMVEPKTQDVMSWLFTQIGSKYPSFHVPDLWIGMTDEVKEGEFRWLSDNTTVTQDFWAKGQPNNGPGNGPENCVVMASEYDELW